MEVVQRNWMLELIAFWEGQINTKPLMNTQVTLILAPDFRLTDKQKSVLENDYGMAMLNFIELNQPSRSDVNEK